MVIVPERVAIGQETDFVDKPVKRVDYESHRVVVVRIESDYYALGDKCSHANFSLSEGEVYEAEREIECWKHGSTFSLVDGKPQSLPAVKPVPVYEIEVDSGTVYLVIPEERQK
jgi:3-phenylpropionate/trans-cinnamate dioxygenase ferredoxin subunit